MNVSCCVNAMEDDSEKSRCCFVISTGNPERVELHTLDMDGKKKMCLNFDGKELIKAIENAMNI